MTSPINARPALRVLLLEDEALIAMMVVEELLGAGYLVQQAATVGEALALIDQDDREYAAAILDVTLPDGTSAPVAAALARRNVPFAFATGYLLADVLPDYSDALRLMKPYDPAAAVAMVDRLVASRGAVPA